MPCRPLLALAAVLSALGSAAFADCPAPAARDFTAASLAEANLAPASLAAANDELDDAGMEIRALLVIRGCRLAYERYKAGLDRNHIHVVHSVTKSFTTTLAGSLLTAGAIPSLDTPIAALVKKPGPATAEMWAAAERITMRNALGMASGLKWQHQPTGLSIYDPANDRLLEAIKPPLVERPGSRFNYSDGDATIYGAAIAAAGKADLLTLARRILFGPMNFGAHEWNYRDREGRYPAGWSLRLRAMDMAKLGQLYLQRGRWNGSPIVTEDFQRSVWTPGPSPQYGLGWWIATDPLLAGTPLYVGNGWKGQRLFVYPTLDLVVAVISSLPGSEERTMADIVGRHLARAAKEGFRPDPAAEQKLAAAATRGFRGTLRVDQQKQDEPGR